MILSSSELHGGRQLRSDQVWTSLVVAPLSEALGEPVEIFARTIWPADELPAIVARWISKEQPDVVVIDRLFGRMAKPVSSATVWAGRTPAVSYNPVGRAVRRWGQYWLGGDTLFSTDYVIDLMRQCIKIAVQGEDRVVQVRTMKRGQMFGNGRGAGKRRDARKAAVDAGLRGFCKDLHVDYVGPGDPEPPFNGTRQGDGMHSDAEGHQVSAARWQRRLLPLCIAAREGTAVQPPPPIAVS